ncbi:T9SS type B sorting domain-containing protein [Flavobacterium tegetincola]|uniref:T9SS type B sorting domain-containing protein n=1 Tax=Flavobacterium tegetincola TaxID=150172 RepID=UPI0004217380|nr:T9SS type B sorting domain-containing protein [Flavobacterium tegetincola]
MQKLFTSLFLLFSFAFYAQGEANIWYFGEKAGLDFNNGAPVALTDGQLDSNEGCAAVSDTNGQLLFYTDGVKIYNKTHQVMVNGAGLMGHSSSTQSATIVPQPGSTTLFYVFTVDVQLGIKGFRYSIIDMALENGNGAVTSVKNILIYTPTLENIGVTKHGNGSDYWIVTHEFNTNNFRAYQLSSEGLSLTPVITGIGAVITGNPDLSAIGTIKIASSGSKLAFTNFTDIAQLFDFDNSSGVLSNELTLTTEAGHFYGSAFSPNESLLYLSISLGKVYQFNLDAANIPNSKILLLDAISAPGQMQIGPDNKLYIANYYSPYLAVVHNPNIQGIGCNFELEGVYLGGKLSKAGLPSFNQSIFFTPSIQLADNCAGESINFSFSTNQTVISAVWDFGDGSTAAGINSIHSYQNSGTYSVSVSVTTALGSSSSAKEITIFQKPQLTSSIFDLKQCDDDNDGFSMFNLNEILPSLVSDVAELTFSFHETEQEAKENTNPIQGITNYINQSVSNDFVFVRVTTNQGCYETAQINLLVSTTLIPATFHETISVCDDALSGSASDGIATFNFSSITPEVQNLYPSGQALNITYYQNLNDALAEQNAISDTANYTNTSSPYTQILYVRVDSQVNNECLGLGPHVTLTVGDMPIVTPLSFVKCDEDQDGMYAFDTNTIESTLLNGMDGLTVTYFDGNNNSLSSPLPNPFVTASQTITAVVTNSSFTACNVTSTISFIVEALPVVHEIPEVLTSICDDESNPNFQDGFAFFDTSLFNSQLLGDQVGMSVSYFDANGAVLPSPLPNPFLSSTQNITVRITNPTNATCYSSTVIPLIVHPIPYINPVGSELICSDNPTFTKTIDAGLKNPNSINDYTYQWFFNDAVISLANNYSLVINEEGIYKVEVTSNFGCTATRTVTVISSEKATIQSVDIIELSEDNSISINITGLGSYVFSLDNHYFQESNIFTNVEAGIYTLYIKDLNGCGTAKREINVLGIPKFFTPNGDGYNDYWNIKGYKHSGINAKDVISVFDRYGKLLVQFNPLNQGWDGNFNGSLMPSSDYWYVLQLEEGKVIRGHFTLKR